MKTVMLIGKGANHVALANRIHNVIGLAGIAIRSGEQPVSRTKIVPRLKRGLSDRLAYPLQAAWQTVMHEAHSDFSKLPFSPNKVTQDINAPEIIEWIEQEQPDLVLVSGTNIIKQATIEVMENTAAVMNLHTGISPYIKGGPNCTNWCLAIGRPDLIGNTIMWLDSGIDSGSLIATERAPLDGTESLTELHCKVMRHAHDIYIRSAFAYSRGLRLPNISQAEIEEGRTFFTREWTLARKWDAIRFHRRHYKEYFSKEWPDIKLVDLPPV